MNIAIVTGASSGMGREFVKQISEKYHKLDEIWVIARRKDKLQKLALECFVTLRILDMDLCKEEDLKRLKETLCRAKPNVRILVNSAGFGWLSDFTDADSEKWNSMIDLNCKALTNMTHLVLPYMKKGARILNMASSAAFVPQPGFAVYAAGKSYVLSFSRALNAELRMRNITVTAICPGPVKTEFFAVADPFCHTPFYKKLVMADADRVVKKALCDAGKGREMSVYGIGMKGFHLLAKMIPHEVFIRFMRF
ncbi:MAG: SDR family NAD(P)-dependent oxidoreductase [Thermoflexaceae bacterium]|nr:SDR family NAD(P)-dependent oxidoreductase [Thermoflexaceae bacterium]